MEEISLRELIEILISRKKIICIVTIFAVACSAIFSFFIIDPKYEAKMILMASGTTNDLGNTQLGNTQTAGNGNIDNMLNFISKYPSMNIETYRQQIKTPEVLEKTIKDLKLEDKYNVNTLADKINLETIKDTNLITIKLEDEDPKLAADIVNKLGENFVLFVSNNAGERSAKTSEYLKEQMEVEKKNYDQALLELKEMLSKPRGADELDLELKAKLKQITNFKIQINELSIKKDALTSAIKVSQSDAGESSSLMLQPNLSGKKSSVPSSINFSLSDSTKVLKIELAEVETSLNSMKSKLAELQNDIEKLQIEYQDKMHKENLAKKKVEIAQKNYETFVAKYEEVKVTESSKIGEASITIVSKAYPSSNPVSPRKALNMAISLVLGLMVGIFTAFFQEYWQNSNTSLELEEKKN